MAIEQLSADLQKLNVRFSSCYAIVSVELVFAQVDRNAIQVVQAKSTKRDAYDSMGDAATSDTQNAVRTTSRLPPFHPSEHPQALTDLMAILCIPEEFLIYNRCLILGWPALSEDTAVPICKRYKRKYHLEAFQMSHVTRFAALLQRRLRCPAISAERCLFRHVTDPSPDNPEVHRSFDCIGIATTLFGKHRRTPRITEDQFLWLVRYFGGPPLWYYNWEPDHLM